MNKIELTIFSIRANGKKVSKRQAIEMYGEEIVTRRLNEALESYYEDSLQLASWMDGMEITLEDFSIGHHFL